MHGIYIVKKTDRFNSKLTLYIFMNNIGSVIRLYNALEIMN